MSVHYDKKRKVHVARWRDSFGVNRSKTFPGTPEGKRQAQAHDHEIKRRKKAGEELPAQNPDKLYLDQLAQLWINAKIAQGRARNWITDWARILNKYFIPHLTAKPIEHYSYDELVGFVASEYPRLANRDRKQKRPMVQTTKNRYLNYLKMMCNFGVEHGHMAKNPLAKWRPPKEPPRQPMLTVDDLRKIHQTAVPHLKWAIEVEWNLGVRAGASELLGLQWQMIDWRESYIRVFGQKTGKWRRVPIDPAFLQRLREMRAKGRTQYIVEYRGGPVKKLRRSLGTACRKAGINYDVRMTDLRHLFATALLQGDADLKAVSEMLGHASTKMTADQYYFYLEGEKRRAIAKLPALDVGPPAEQSAEHPAREKG